jgi:hypothetical protein
MGGEGTMLAIYQKIKLSLKNYENIVEKLIFRTSLNL